MLNVSGKHRMEHVDSFCGDMVGKANPLMEDQCRGNNLRWKTKKADFKVLDSSDADYCKDDDTKR